MTERLQKRFLHYGFVKAQSEQCPALRRISGLNGSVLPGHDHACQSKTDANAFLTGILPPVKALKKVGDILCGKAFSRILNGYFSKALSQQMVDF